MFHEVNRSSVIITPTQDFFNMLSEIEKGPAISYEGIEAFDSSTVYLIPNEFFDEDEILKYLKDNYMTIYFCEVIGWYNNPELFPKKVTWNKFRELFSISIQTMVYDLSNEPPEHED